MSNKIENVRNLYLKGIRDGDAANAVNRYTGERYTQHSTGVANGPQGFIDFFEPFIARNPDRDIQLIRMIEDGPYVFCQAYQSLNDGAAEWVTTDLFDTDEQELIVEHWDVIGQFKKNLNTGEDMIGGDTIIKDQDKTVENKKHINEFVKRVLQQQELNLFENFVHENCIQHIPNVANGREALKAWFNSDEFGEYEMLFKCIGQGNFVVTYGKTHADNKDYAVFHIYRLEEGLIVECWDNAEEILPREQWNNSGKF
ncbi:MAG: hypothetical protein AAGB12_07985 [Pseudomonadota bacterium]